MPELVNNGQNTRHKLIQNYSPLFIVRRIYLQKIKTGQSFVLSFKTYFLFRNELQTLKGPLMKHVCEGYLHFVSSTLEIK